MALALTANTELQEALTRENVVASDGFQRYSLEAVSSRRLIFFLYESVTVLEISSLNKRVLSLGLQAPWVCL
jgi:hypothetical protein